MQVRIWKEEVIIPTYATGEPNANPMFFDNRVYQGSTGKVYPYPIIESVGDTKKDHSYTAVFLENDYLNVMVLPQLGGRIQRIIDKITGEDAVYYNEVIKPALVGLLGPWISGGIEFNWPQHHRPTTYMPVDYQLKEDASNKSVSIRLHDTDRMYGTESIATITLYEGRAYIEITGQLYNPTQFPQTFLWWANPAIAANDYTQSVFPPDVHAVMDHGKRDVSTFPIATGIYYKHDYSEGVDISRYKNIPVPTSYMAYHSDYDFVGSYDHQKNTGILHVANHHISPGKKQWTWGSGDFGKAWNKNLTDENGPYIELMTGVFTDNQPDFTFLEPGEMKTFNQYFLPYKHAPNVINASKKLLLSLDKRSNLSLYASVQITVRLLVYAHDQQILFDKIISLHPTEHYETTLKDREEVYFISVLNSDGSPLYASTIQQDTSDLTIPEPAKAIPDPTSIPTIEELYLAAVHLEQYRHATFRSEPYYKEALRRDPYDYRCNVGYGELLLKRGLFEKSELFFRRAIDRAIKHNPNPIDCKAYTLLGLSLFHQGRYDEAYGAFYKATWDGKQQEQGFLYLGILTFRKGYYQEAQSFFKQSLSRNSNNLKTRGYLALTLGDPKAIAVCINEILKIDPFDMVARSMAQKKPIVGELSHRYLGLAANYGDIGLYDKALEALILAEKENPLVLYYKAYYSLALGKTKEAEEFLQNAESLEDSTYFPNTLDDVKALDALTHSYEHLWKARYLLGMYWYDKRESTRAKNSWEAANRINPTHAKTLRCLSLVYFNQEGNEERATAALEQAFTLDPHDDRLLYELDQLYKKCALPPRKRKAFLEQHLTLVYQRDDLLIEYITLLNLTQEYEKARELELSHTFHPWEGAEGKITTQYVITHIELAKQHDDTSEAIALLHKALSYPQNLNEGKLEGNKDNEVHYHLGCFYEKENNSKLAKQHWKLATLGMLTASGALYYYDQSPHQLLYKGLAFSKLGRKEEAERCFNELLEYGKTHMDDVINFDYFAVSLPDLQVFTEDLSKRNNIHCHFLIGLGYWGKGDLRKAKSAFQIVIKGDPAHIDTTRMLLSID